MTIENNSDKWVLILGANSGMALAIAKRFAKAGFNIYLASRNKQECEKNAADIRLRFSVKAEGIFFDAIAFNSHLNFYNALPIKPEGVIVSFGVMYDQTTAQHDFNLAKIMMDTNYIGAVSVLEVIAQDFENRKHGFIVGISSVAGDRGRQSNYIYGSSKSAFSTYMDGLRHRLFHSGVQVLTVKPGFVATKMTAGLDLPTKLTAQPEEVGDAIFRAVLKKRDTLYVKWIWCWIMLIIRNVPEFIFKKTQM